MSPEKALWEKAEVFEQLCCSLGLDQAALSPLFQQSIRLQRFKHTMVCLKLGFIPSSVNAWTAIFDAVTYFGPILRATLSVGGFLLRNDCYAVARHILTLEGYSIVKLKEFQKQVCQDVGLLKNPNTGYTLLRDLLCEGNILMFRYVLDMTANVPGLLTLSYFEEAVALNPTKRVSLLLAMVNSRRTHHVEGSVDFKRPKHPAFLNLRKGVSQQAEEVVHANLGELQLYNCDAFSPFTFYEKVGSIATQMLRSATTCALLPRMLNNTESSALLTVLQNWDCFGRIVFGFLCFQIPSKLHPEYEKLAQTVFVLYWLGSKKAFLVRERLLETLPPLFYAL
jgi:hypothetical protein